ncbi:MAG: OTU domain-containing protein [Gloeomargaritales cyanobacterium]
MTLSKMYTALKYNDLVFKLHDVPGDGNCLYHSIVESNLLNVSEHSVLRTSVLQEVLRRSQNGDNFIDKVFRSHNTTDTLSDYVERQSRLRQYGSTMEMCFIAIVHGVITRSIVSMKNGLLEFNVNTYFENTLRSPENVIRGSTIWIYNHQFKNPFSFCTTIKERKYFFTLIPVNNALERESAVHTMKHLSSNYCFCPEE